MNTLIDILLILARVFVIFMIAMLFIPVLIWLERRLVARMQVRIGPNRVGPEGLLQPIADAIKLVLKEDITPSCVDRPVYTLAPGISIATAIMFFAVLPFNPTITIAGRQIPVQIADLNIGLLYILAVSSIGVYAVVLGGWASQSKYSLLGGLRSAAQMISYELSMGLSLIGVVMATGTLSTRGIVEHQLAHGWFIIPQFIGFLIFLIAAIAELNRAPFDLPEAESELTGGFNTEYSSFRFAMFFMAEYVGMLAMGGVVATVFLGGWSGPILPGIIWFFIKVFAFVFFLVWIRATFPRLRYDQLMRFGWKVLIPVALLNILATGIYMAFVS